MTIKLDPEHIEYFSLHRFGSWVEVKQSRNLRLAFWNLHPQPNSTTVGDIEQVDHHFETLGGHARWKGSLHVFGVIDCSEINTHCVSLVSQLLRHIEIAVTIDVQDKLPTTVGHRTTEHLGFKNLSYLA